MRSWADTCFLIDTLERGGAQRQLLLFARHLNSLSIPPFRLIAFREPLTLLSDFAAAGVDVSVVNKTCELDFPFLFNLKNKLSEINPRIVVSFLPTADMWGRLAAIMAGVPTIGCSIRSIHKDYGFVRNSFINLMHWKSSFIVCNSTAAAKQMVESLPRLSNKVRVIQNGIQVSPPKVIQGKAIVKLILVARLVPIKDVATLIKALALIHTCAKFRLTIVGDGPSRPELERLTVELGLSSVIDFAGEQESPRDFIEHADIGILTSLFEGLSNVIMEYMAAGLPVIATDVGGNAELVKDDETGYLFPVGNERLLAKRVVKLIENVEIRRRFGNAGRKIILQNYSLNETVFNWNALLHGFSGAIS